MKADEYFVYEHIFPNGKRYIGITKQNPEVRWGYKGGHYNEQFVGRAIKKYGWDNIEHNILFSNLSKNEACKREQELISKYKTNQREYGYNNSIGGETGQTNSYMCREAVEFIRKHRIGTAEDNSNEIIKWWNSICKDELEAKVFNIAFEYVMYWANKIQVEQHLMVENYTIIGAINLYLEAWTNNWTPYSAQYNSLYFLTHSGECIYQMIFSKQNDEWKLKEPVIFGEGQLQFAI